jgi:hypothetical protein
MKYEASSVARKTTNPIRNIVDRSRVTPNPEKALISLSLGDPTVFGNLNTAEQVIDAMKRVLESSKADGYAPVTGTKAAKEAIAKRYQTRFSTQFIADVSANNVFQTRSIVSLGHCYYVWLLGCFGFGYFCSLHAGKVCDSDTFARIYAIWNALRFEVDSKY